MRFVLSLAALLFASAAISAPAQAGEKRPLLAAGLNFFVPGAGYLYNNEKPLYVSLPMIAGAGGLTYVEQFHDFGGGENLKAIDPTAYWVMFGSVLTLNTGVAIDAFREAKAINGDSAALSTPRERRARVTLSPAVMPAGAPGDAQAAYGLRLGASL